jgi:hypothetical protein
MKNKILIGSIENFDLPDLGIYEIEVRVDTGAKTSSLHVDNLSYFSTLGKDWVKFDIHPNVHNVDEVVACKSPLLDQRKIKSSNGESEERYVIQTRVRLGPESWPIEISLTDRSDMNYLMLFGREGMGARVLVDPSATFILPTNN